MKHSASALYSSAHGKFIVTGEHAVMYGAPCLVYPLTSASLELSIQVASSLSVRWNGNTLSASQEELIGKSLDQMQFRELIPEPFKKGFELSVLSQIPIGSGLGSSAAFCVALARLLPIEKEDVFTRALLGEHAFHGKPSGADPAAVLAEAPIVFQKQGLSSSTSSLPNLSPAAKKFCWVLRDTKESHETLKVIENLKKLEAQTHREFIEALSTQSQRFVDSLQNFIGESAQIKEAKATLETISLVHEKMGLVNQTMRDCLKSLQLEGAIGTKLTGAGCGGYVIGLFDEKSMKTTYLPRKNDYVVTLSGDDVSREWISRD